MTKNELRQSFLARRNLLDEKMIFLFNTLLLDNLRTVLESLKPKSLGVFYPMQNEVDLRSLSQDYTLHYPDIVDKEIIYLKDISRFKEAVFNTTVPDHHDETPLSEIDIIIVPGIVFSKDFYRIGYGKGYYDKLLKKTNALKIGVCFELFVLDNIPIESHDEAVDMIVTDQRILKR
ncbi:MAG: 5-formyltetrahydrofolate cyclo-ligase [Candidatus Izemoplasmataceae bacterium]